MLEITTITILVITFILIGRRTKPRQLERPVVVERTGNYRVTLAPKVNLAITFIEHIVHCYRAQPALPGDSATLHLAVSDPAMKRYGVESYLLAITLRHGMLYFQAMQPVADQGSDYRQLDEFAQAALINQLPADAVLPEQEGRIMDAVKQAASGHEIGIQRLAE